ncbi:MAG: putative Manganese-transporting ATPase 13A1, partial [Streblomastix strix]
MKLRLIVPLKRAQLYQRWDLLTLLVIYGGLCLAIKRQIEEKHLFLWTPLFFVLIGSIFLGVIFILLQEWILRFRMFIQYRKVPVNKADFVYVVPFEHKGQLSIEPIQWVDIPKDICGSVSAPGLFFYSDSESRFVPMPFPDKITISEFFRQFESGGLKDDDFQDEQNPKKYESNSLKLWGDNSLAVPLPSFVSLLKVQLTAPLFLFQVFCSILWLFDEYRGFSVFTIAMIFIMECGSVAQRQGNMKKIRQMASGPKPIYAMRGNEWVVVMSDSLKPGDVVSVSLKQPRKVTKKKVNVGGVKQKENLLLGDGSNNNNYDNGEQLSNDQSIGSDEDFNQKNKKKGLKKKKEILNALQSVKNEDEMILELDEQKKSNDDQQQLPQFGTTQSTFTKTSTKKKTTSKTSQQQSIQNPSASARSFATGEIDNTLPCDVTLLAGRIVVNEALLTGESMPVVKEGLLTIPKDEWNKNFDPKSNTGKQHMLLAGTSLLQTVTVDRLQESQGNNTFQKLVDGQDDEDDDEEHGNNNNSKYNNSNISSINSIDVSKYICPDGGCPAIVTRTGFSTTQGKLLRAIIFFSEAQTANSAESLLFMLMMMIVAAFTGWYVYTHAKKEHTTPFKLFLRISEIVTSVIPPELPMQLSMAVNTAITALQKRGIFCTEPFRIPDAGRIDMVCFDKTGTLTEDKLVVEGIVTDLASQQKMNNNNNKDNDRKKQQQQSVGKEKQQDFKLKPV